MRTVVNKKIIFALLFFLVPLGQVISDLYLPSLTAIADGLNTTNNLLQLSIAIFMYGYAFSQLIYGPLSDGVGRKGPLTVGLSICFIGSVICTFAHSIDVLLWGRFLQGLGAGASMSLSRSILRDVFEGNDLARRSSYLAVVGVAFMAGGPFLGGFIQNYLGWRANFSVLLIYATLSLIAVLLLLPETNKHKNSENLKAKAIKTNLTVLLKSPIFMGYTTCLLLAYAGTLTWITAGPILLMNVLGLGPIQFGWVFALTGLVLMVTNVVNGKLVGKYGLEKILPIGLKLQLAAASVLLILGLMGYLNLWVIIIPVIFHMGSASFVYANTVVGSLQPFTKIAGMAGALNSFLQIAGGAIASMVLAYLPDNNQIPLALGMLITPALSLLVLRFVVNRTARGQV